VAREITNMQVKLISLVAAGANNKKIIYKDEKFDELLRVDFEKSDEEQGVVYGIVYAPDEVDSQGDYANSEEIKKAAYNFMKRADLSYCVDVNHNFDIANAYICESWIVKSKDEFFDEVGAWAVGIKIEDENLRNLIKSGQLSGLSMYGSGIIKSEEIEPKGLIETIKEVVKGLLPKDMNKDEILSKGENMNKEEVAELVKAQLNENEAANNAKIEELSKQINELSAKLEDVNKELSKSKQSEELKKSENSASGGIL